MILHGWQVPDVVLGAGIAAIIALLAATLTFIGVLLSNREARLRLQMQLDHDAKQSNRTREMELRRDVYLPVAEAIMRSATTVSRLADMRIDENELMRQLTESAAVVAKAHVVANGDTVAALVRFQSSLMKNFMVLSAARIPLRVRLSELDRLSCEIANASSEAARWVELMKQFNLQCSSDVRKWEALESQSEMTRGHLHDLVDQHRKLSTTQLQEVLQYAKQATVKGLATMRLLPDALLAARAEMELRIDEASYRALLEASAVEAELAVGELLDKIPMPSSA